MVDRCMILVRMLFTVFAEIGYPLVKKEQKTIRKINQSHCSYR